MGGDLQLKKTSRSRNEISQMEWNKHRALAPIAVSELSGIIQVLITGTTDDPDVFAVSPARLMTSFRNRLPPLKIGKQDDPMLDSSIRWYIKPVGFQPVPLRFDFDRPGALGLLSAEILWQEVVYFTSELLQNSVDAIDTRTEVLRYTVRSSFAAEFP